MQRIHKGLRKRMSSSSVPRLNTYTFNRLQPKLLFLWGHITTYQIHTIDIFANFSYTLTASSIDVEQCQSFWHHHKYSQVWKLFLHYYLLLLQNFYEGFKPKIKRMQNLAQPKTIHISESGVGLLTHNTSEYEMGRLHRPESFVTPHNEA